MTNYERIKQMSVEEMADYISHICRRAKRTQKEENMCLMDCCKLCLKQHFEAEVEE